MAVLEGDLTSGKLTETKTQSPVQAFSHDLVVLMGGDEEQAMKLASKVDKLGPKEKGAATLAIFLLGQALGEEDESSYDTQTRQPLHVVTDVSDIEGTPETNLATATRLVLRTDPEVVTLKEFFERIESIDSDATRLLAEKAIMASMKLIHDNDSRAIDTFFNSALGVNPAKTAEQTQTDGKVPPVYERAVDQLFDDVQEAEVLSSTTEVMSQPKVQTEASPLANRNVLRFANRLFKDERSRLITEDKVDPLFRLVSELYSPRGNNNHATQQLQRLRISFDGKSGSEIAEEFGVHVTSVNGGYRGITANIQSIYNAEQLQRELGLLLDSDTGVGEIDRATNVENEEVSLVPILIKGGRDYKIASKATKHSDITDEQSADQFSKKSLNFLYDNFDASLVDQLTADHISYFAEAIVNLYFKEFPKTRRPREQVIDEITLYFKGKSDKEISQEFSTEAAVRVARSVMFRKLRECCDMNQLLISVLEESFDEVDEEVQAEIDREKLADMGYDAKPLEGVSGVINLSGISEGEIIIHEDDKIDEMPEEEAIDKREQTLAIASKLWDAEVIESIRHLFNEIKVSPEGARARVEICNLMEQYASRWFPMLGISQNAWNLADNIAGFRNKSVSLSEYELKHESKIKFYKRNLQDELAQVISFLVDKKLQGAPELPKPHQAQRGASSSLR